MKKGLTRRELFGKSSVLAVGMMAPPWLSSIARADLIKLSSGKSLDPDNILVVCQLSGGNDGLNTIVPFTDPNYYRARPNLGISKEEVIKIESDLGLHPKMEGIAELFKEGKVAVINNVGYPNPNRSHFKSMDIWQSASPEGTMKYGWVGRTMDIFSEQGALSPVAGIGLSTEKPLALTANRASIPCFASLNDVLGMVGDPETEKMLREIQGMAAKEGSATRTIQKANNTALDAMNLLKSQLDGFKTKQEYGNDRFGQGFKQISQLVATSDKTRVIYFSAGGFDTHSKQEESHANLLGGFSDAVLKFQREMEAIGKADKVTVLVFSEFGRRSYENGSAGTDHGQAGPMFLIGKNVKGGFHGDRPDLQDLDKGDLKWKIDFRDVYAAALDDWLGADAKTVLGGSVKPLSLIK
jgi:uncharacterized protein (DUF1501 family)